MADVVADLGTARQDTYTAYRRRIADDGSDLPETFEEVIAAVIRFADPVFTGTTATARRWQAASSSWQQQGTHRS